MKQSEEQTECQCRECKNARALTEAIKRIKAELPPPVYDWEDLERQDRERQDRESRNRG